MNSTWYSVAVVLLWVATMSWLICKKVVPSLLMGEPPNYRTIVEAQQQDPLAGWSMAWNDRRVGWALNTTVPLRNEMTEIRSLVHFDDLPLQEMTSSWLRSMLLPDDGVPIRLQLEARSTLIFDPLKRLSQFESSLGFEGMDDVVKVRGTIDGTELAVSVHTGDFNYDNKLNLPRNALLSDALSPQTRLPGLREGQKWNLEVYSPLRPPNMPVEIIQAKVEGREPVVWGGRVQNAWLVVYRTDPGVGSTGARSPRGKLWVHDDGTVLKQEVNLFNSRMTFERLSRREAAALAESAGEWEWCVKSGGWRVEGGG